MYEIDESEQYLRDIRHISVGHIETIRRRGGRKRRQRRLWITLHTDELVAIKRRATADEISMSQVIRWAMQQDDREQAMQRITGIPTDELLELPTDDGKPKASSQGWRRRVIQWP